MPPAQGPGRARLAFHVSRSGGVKGRVQESGAWCYHPCRSTDRRTDALFWASAPGPRGTHTGKEGGPWCPQPPRGNGGDLNRGETRAPGPLTAILTAQPGSERSFHGVDGPTWLVEEGEGLNTNLLPHEPLSPAQRHRSLDGEGDREQRLSALLPRTGHSAWALSRGMLTVALSTHAVSASCNRAMEFPGPGAGNGSNPGLPEHGGRGYFRTRNTTEGISTFLHHAITN